MIKFFPLIILLSFFYSCSGYINSINKDLDRSYDSPNKNEPDKFEAFKVERKGSKQLTSNDISNLKPNVKRKYGPEKRYRASDLRDNDEEGSLWTGRGEENFLFSKNKNRKNGDIIILEVQGRLKKEIALELSRAFPIRKINDKNDPAKAAKPDPTAATAENEKSGELDENPKIYDHISSIVSEEISKDHLIIKGRKDVLYKNRKRLIEVKALIAKRDITDNDTITSSSIIESSIKVLR